MLKIGTFTFAEFFKQMRNQRGMSQVDLAAGIIHRSLISKIENGHYIPEYGRLALLVERLGFGMDNIGKNHHDDMQEIEGCINRNDFDNAEKRIAQLEKNDDFMDSIYNQQAVFLFKALLMMKNNDQQESVRKAILDGLAITIRNFDEKKLADYILTANDIKLINQLAILYWKHKETDAAIQLMHGLIQNLESNCTDVRYRARMLPWLYFNLINYLYEEKRYNEEIPLLDKGIEYCIKSSSLYFLPHLIGNKAWCKYRLGDTTEGFKYFRRAYHMYDGYDLREPRSIVHRFVLENYNVDLSLLNEISIQLAYMGGGK
ncbi:MAG: helix-turn-helix domain-containing protein [Defluviitaleaceae bacterium]|nr:helix-turn-helix domain-containing protein [Defluviitaleaceae bacterium]